MSRKPTKGYFVKGQFVALGSELDLEFKRELKGSDAPSRTELKAESDALQKLGTELLALRADLLARLDLSEKFRDAIAEAKRITNFEGRRRQMQFIGKLMRLQEPDVLAQIRQALDEQRNGSAQDNLALHQAEQWRDRLIADEEAFGQWMDAFALTDSQQLRALIRQARKDAKPEKPGLALRHGSAYRDIFQIVRQHLIGATDRPGDNA